MKDVCPATLKLGNFTLEFTDLVIPVSCIPITITRSYDTLNALKDDLGNGWLRGSNRAISWHGSGTVNDSNRAT